MINARFEHITAEHIQALVADGVPEGRTIEYKQDLPGNSDSAKKEFLADVSSFANASGGDVVFGIAERRDADGKPTGIPEAAVGVALTNIDQEIQRLENVLRDGIDPRIPGVRMKAVEGFSSGPVIVIEVPRSWVAPHMVGYKASPRFFSRTSAGKYPLDVAEIRAAFVQSQELPEQIRRFRDERIGRILAGDTPCEMESVPKVVFHIVPLQAFLRRSAVDHIATRDLRAALPPMSTSSWDGRINIDGFLSFYRPPHSKCHAYTQLFRSGIIEAVDGVIPVSDELAGRLFGGQVEAKFVYVGQKYFSLLKELDVEPPYVVMLSVVGAKGLKMHTFFHKPLGEGGIDRDVVITPEVILETTPDELTQPLRPAFDALWQAGGLARSFSYDKDGKWQMPA